VEILTDDDLTARVSMRDAVAAVEQALRDKGNGRFVTPPRHYATLGSGTFVFTIGGGSGDGVAGFRVYGFGGLSNEASQLVVVYDAATGQLRGIVQGTRVGAMRTGALGGVAIKYAAREDASAVAVIGAGTQARTQLEAAAVVRSLKDVRVYSRTPGSREAFAQEMGEQLGLDIRPVASTEEAIRGADIVITATSSSSPTWDAALIEPGMHVTSIRLARSAHEVDPAIGEQAAAIFTGSMEQLRSYPGGFFLEDRIDSVTDLADHVANDRPVRTSSEQVTFYCSTGLSGTEVVVADLALSASQRSGS